jgi:histidinol dehydrogenase
MIMRRIELARGQSLSEEDLARSGGLDAEVLGVAQRIIDDVRLRGDEALREYTATFDKAEISDFLVTEAEIDAAMSQVPAQVGDALATAADSIAEFHSQQVPRSWFTTRDDGVYLGQKVTPLDRVGVYVPGGRAAYPSSVLMNAIPALVAGVGEIAMVVPPGPDGTVSPVVLGAARMLGLSEIYKVGGAQAIAALAYGTKTIPRVDKITGPGNAYVTAAKKLVMGDVGIDMLAGPSEVLIIADETAEPGFVAIDLMAQAEHDPKAATYLVTTDAELADDVERAIEALLVDAPRAEFVRRALTDNGRIIVVPDLDEAVEVANTVAPEHLEVQVSEAFELLGAIRHAGAIFLGHWTPTSVGDYIAGPNHVLPTGGTARFSSPLSVDDFVKRSSVVSYSSSALDLDGPVVMELATAEGLDAHAAAIALRISLPELEEE